jgi:hypothetical protein
VLFSRAVESSLKARVSRIALLLSGGGGALCFSRAGSGGVAGSLCRAGACRLGEESLLGHAFALLLEGSS